MAIMTTEQNDRATIRATISHLARAGFRVTYIEDEEGRLDVIGVSPDRLIEEIAATSGALVIFEDATSEKRRGGCVVFVLGNGHGEAVCDYGGGPDFTALLDDDYLPAALSD